MLLIFKENLWLSLSCVFSKKRGLSYPRETPFAIIIKTLSYYTVIPPSTLMTVPLMYAASSEARNAYAAAISSGLPRRFTGTLSSIDLSTSSGILRTISVRIKPGATALTVTPFLPSSRAIVLVIQISPALVAT